MIIKFDEMLSELAMFLKKRVKLNHVCIIRLKSSFFSTFTQSH